MVSERRLRKRGAWVPRFGETGWPLFSSGYRLIWMAVAGLIAYAVVLIAVEQLNAR